MCLGNLFTPKPPKVKGMVPPPAVKPKPEPPPQPKKPRDLDKDVAPPEVKYGSKPSDALLSKKTSGSSVIPLNRSMLQGGRGEKSGLGGTVE